MVLTQIEDPYDLWVTWRQVSKLLRIEAERAYRLRFLPSMKLVWAGHLSPMLLDRVYMHASFDAERRVEGDDGSLAALKPSFPGDPRDPY